MQFGADMKNQFEADLVSGDGSQMNFRDDRQCFHHAAFEELKQIQSKED